MANKITLKTRQLVVEPQGLDKILSLRKKLGCCVSAYSRFHG